MLLGKNSYLFRVPHVEEGKTRKLGFFGTRGKRGILSYIGGCPGTVFPKFCAFARKVAPLSRKLPPLPPNLFKNASKVPIYLESSRELTVIGS
ncbi:hypothetical protein FIU87_20565 [Bacillus sp. THAF10]|nr:hypothetical protein FIU87_20565 [Bacillus sp. THAF10]